MKLPARFAAFALALALGAPAALADADPKDDKVPDAAGSGADAQVPQEDPIEATRKIIELMREVEDRLAEADTDAFTQKQQKQIVDALDFGEQSLSALQKLIEQLEAQQQSGGGGGGGGSDGGQQSGQQGQQGNQGRNQQGSRREQDARSSRPIDPQGGQERNDQASRNDGRTLREAPLDPSRPKAVERTAGVDDNWATLPMKDAQEVRDSTARKKPLKHKDDLEAYFKRLANGGKD